jgi:G protein-coupled receptor Mth (Methuselah protein)
LTTTTTSTGCMNTSTNYFRGRFILQSKQSFEIFIRQLEQMYSTVLSRSESASDIYLVQVSLTNYNDNASFTCSSGRLMEKEGVPLLHNSNGSVALLHSRRRVVNVSNTFYSIDLSDIAEANMLWFCDPDTLQCPMIAYNADEYEFVNDTVYILDTDVSYGPGTFQQQDSRAYVCSNFTRWYQQRVAFFEYSETQRILTITVTSVSLVALSVTIVVYCTLPALRNINGNNLVALSSTLMLAQGLLLVDTIPHPYMCTALAVVLHYLWLSVFTWMSVIAYGLARTFHARAMIVNASMNAGSRFRKYCVMAWGCPVVAVCVCVGLDFSGSGVNVGYGDSGICWITNPMASLYAFAVPVAVLLSMNIVCFGVTIHGIEKVKNLSNDIQKQKSDRFRCIMYAQLSTLLGFTWMFGFIAAFAKVAPVWYVYIVLNGLQGFLIFVAFVLNGRVFAMTKKAVTEGSSTRVTLSTSRSKKNSTFHDAIQMAHVSK